MSGWYAPPPTSSASSSPVEWTIHVTKICCSRSDSSTHDTCRVLTSLRVLRKALPSCRLLLCHDLPCMGPSDDGSASSPEATTTTAAAAATCESVGRAAPGPTSSSVAATSTQSLLSPSPPSSSAPPLVDRRHVDDGLDSSASSSSSCAKPPDPVVYTSRTGTSYHLTRSHAGQTPIETRLSVAIQKGFGACRSTCCRTAPPSSNPPLPSSSSTPPFAAACMVRPSPPPLPSDESTSSSAPKPSDGNWSIASLAAKTSGAARFPRVFFFDLEANKALPIHPTRQIAVRSLDGSVAWMRNVVEDFGDAWREFELQVDPHWSDEQHSPAEPIYLVAHNGRAFDEKILDAEFRHWTHCRRRPHWTFVDSLPLIHTWLRSLQLDRVWKHDLVTLTKSLLRLDIDETNLALMHYWTATKGLRGGAGAPHAPNASSGSSGPHTIRTDAKHHDADFDCVILRSVFLLAIGSFAAGTLMKRTSGVSLYAVENRVTNALRAHMRASPDVTLEALIIAVIDRREQAPSFV